MINPKSLCAAALLALSSNAAVAQITANASFTNNYIWRGLTQTINQAAVQGGLDWASDSGFYVGTWASNVEYAPGDPYSYEHDIYFGYSGETDSFSYDVGWLYYNYDAAADIDFHEIYGTLGFGDFSVTGYILGGTEADEAAYEADFGVTNADFGFGEAFYLSLDYSFETESGLGITLHAGHHDGDFMTWFNFATGSYTDYSVSFHVNNFTFMITDTDLDSTLTPGPTPFRSGLDVSGNDNGEPKFVVSYSMDFDL
jgi:uncharacterized protein (TIGR02001 family)